MELAQAPGMEEGSNSKRSRTAGSRTHVSGIISALERWGSQCSTKKHLSAHVCRNGYDCSGQSLRTSHSVLGFDTHLFLNDPRKRCIVTFMFAFCGPCGERVT
jgi:hypothetical protein